MPLGDVRAATLHEMPGQLFAQTVARLALDLAEALEGGIEEPEQAIEGLLVAAVGRGGQHDDMPVRRSGEPLQQLMALMAALARRSAGMRLVDDDELRAGTKELAAALLALDVVEADDREGVGGKDTFAGRQAALTAAAWMWKRSSSSPVHWSTRCGGQRTAIRSISPRSSSSRAISPASM